jgi:hypothetical protein
MDVDSLAANMVNLSDYLQAQVGTGIDVDALRNSHSHSLVAQITSMKRITVIEGLRLTTTVRGGGWTQPQITAMAVSDRVAASMVTHDTSAGKRCMQRADSFERFLTTADWTILHDPGESSASKVDRIVTRAMSVGLSCPGEPTLAHLTAIVLCCSKKLTAGAEIQHELLLAMKREFKVRKTRQYPFIHRPFIPDTPGELDEACLEYAYGDDREFPSPPVVISNLACVARDIPLRATNMQLRANRPGYGVMPTMAGGSGGGSGMPGSSGGNGHDMMIRLFHAMMGGSGGGSGMPISGGGNGMSGSAGGNGSGLEVFNPSGKRAQLALQDVLLILILILALVSLVISIIKHTNKQYKLNFT